MTSRNKEPVHIKPRQNIVSPAQLSPHNFSPDTRLKNLNSTEPFTQRADPLSCINYDKQRPSLQKENFLPISTSPCRFFNAQPPCKPALSAPILVTTIPTRDLEALQQRLQTAEIKLHELTLVKSTLQMERKQFCEAYQELKISSEQTKRFLSKAFDDLKAEHESMLRDKDHVRMENRMLNERLSERGQKIEEALKEVRERVAKPATSKSDKEQHKKYKELREKVIVSLRFAYEAIGMDRRLDDPDYLLEHSQKVFDDMLSLHNSQKAVLKDQLHRLRKQLEQKGGGGSAADSEKVETSIIDQYQMADPSTQSIPLEQERNGLITWKANIEAVYTEKLREQEKAHQREMEEQQAKFNNQLLELQRDVRGLYEKRCENCQEMTRTILILNQQVNKLRAQKSIPC